VKEAKSKIQNPKSKIPYPTLDLEQEIAQAIGTIYIAGLDEAGRGALAGPVVAAAVILPLDQPDQLAHLTHVHDSKLLTPGRREPLYDTIITHALAYGIGSATAQEIDQDGILKANFRAMRAAVAQLNPPPAYLLVDGPLPLRATTIPQKPVVRGDSRCLTIAAASILAKVTRDRLMVELDQQYPLYGFARHKGYATRQHLTAIQQHGPCPLHRFTFAPIRRPLL
jgi:ribonuclease HII